MSDRTALVARWRKQADHHANARHVRDDPYDDIGHEHAIKEKLLRECADALAALAPTPPPADLDYAPYWVVALRACDEALDKHSLWCGHKKDSPGDPSINRAERLIRSALRRADAEAAAPPTAEAAPEPLPADLMAEIVRWSQHTHVGQSEAAALLLRVLAALRGGSPVEAAPEPTPALPDNSWHLNTAQVRAAKEWAADDRLWTTQETVEFNLQTFARAILTADRTEPIKAVLENRAQPMEPTPAGRETLGAGVVDWRGAALRIGEELAANGPHGYSKFTAEQWLAWALAALRGGQP